MRTTAKLMAAGFALTTLHAATINVASAKINCDGPYQIVDGSPIATPYCEDNYLAYVARSYGIGVSGREIRRSYNTKRHVCQTIGHDTRVANICAGLRNEDRPKIFEP
jgi:hypothetical protein